MSDRGRRFTGFAKGYDIQAATEDAIKKAGPATMTPQEFILVEVKLSRGGVVGPATYVTLAARGGRVASGSRREGQGARRSTKRRAVRRARTK